MEGVSKICDTKKGACVVERAVHPWQTGVGTTRASTHTHMRAIQRFRHGFMQDGYKIF